ncbi:hypothetical protein D3C71_1594250 [compost metagenome]
MMPVVEANWKSITLPSTACVASAAPLNGTCMNFTFVARARPSAAKCGVVPGPPEP